MSEPISAVRLLDLGAITETAYQVADLCSYGCLPNNDVYTFPLSRSGSHITAPSRLVFVWYSDHMSAWSVFAWDTEDDKLVWLGWTVKTEEEFRDLCRILKVKLKETS